jgi:two-component system, chemotaxis family, protein-glutamate methylesterase/glutaminase
MAERSIKNRYEVLLIGGSAGSLEVILEILPRLRDDLDLAIILVLHRKSGESVLVDVLRNRIPWTVMEAEEKDAIEKRNVYIAPPDYHLMIEGNKTFSLDFSEKIHYSRPSIDVTFECAAEVYGRQAIALLLSGANADGAEGLMNIKLAGGLTIVQDPAEASVSFMPQFAVGLFKADYIVTSREIVDIINRVA